MQLLVRPSGSFGAEFMMPTEKRHRMAEHYTSPERLTHHFPGDRDILLTPHTSSPAAPM
jgi:hypothetical protein